jgi:hypothetical protein
MPLYKVVIRKYTFNQSGLRVYRDQAQHTSYQHAKTGQAAIKEALTHTCFNHYGDDKINLDIQAKEVDKLGD